MPRANSPMPTGRSTGFSASKACLGGRPENLRAPAFPTYRFRIGMSEHPVTIGFIGLGNIGLPLALRLGQAGGFRVIGHDRAASRVGRMTEAGGQFEAAATVEQLVEASQCVMTCLPSADAVREVYCGQAGLAAALKPGQATIDFSTAPPELAIEVGGQVAARGGKHFEMPVVGSVHDAAEGKLHLLLSAEGVQTRSDLSPLLARIVSVLGSGLTIAGAPGSASRFKIIQNGLGLVQLNAIAEAIGVCTAAGLSAKSFTEFVAAAPGMANTPLFRRVAPAMVEPERAENDARLAIAAKDAHLYQAVAARSGARAGLSALSSALFAEAEEAGLSNEDFTQICRVFLPQGH